MRSKSEIKVGKALKKKGFSVLYQYKIGGYVADIYLPQMNVTVEVHGPHHILPERVARDQVRSRYILQRGFKEYIISAADANIPGNVRDFICRIEAENQRGKKTYTQFNNSMALQLQKYREAVCS